MQNSGDLVLLRRLLREGLRGLQECAEPNRSQYAELEGVDLRGLAGLVGDLGEPLGRMYPNAQARAVAAATARAELAAALAVVV